MFPKLRLALPENICEGISIAAIEQILGWWANSTWERSLHSSWAPAVARACFCPGREPVRYWVTLFVPQLLPATHSKYGTNASFAKKRIFVVNTHPSQTACSSLWLRVAIWQERMEKSWDLAGLKSSHSSRPCALAVNHLRKNIPAWILSRNWCSVTSHKQP